VARGVLQQAGVIQVERSDEMFAVADTVSRTGGRPTRRVAVLSEGGGPISQAADALAEGLHRAERMLDCLATLAHGLWICIKALLHSFEQMLMLPSWNPPLWPCRALRFKRTILTGCGPVPP
jgi:hypothetical protein